MRVGCKSLFPICRTSESSGSEAKLAAIEMRSRLFFIAIPLILWIQATLGGIIAEVSVLSLSVPTISRYATLQC